MIDGQRLLIRQINTSIAVMPDIDPASGIALDTGFRRCDE